MLSQEVNDIKDFIKENKFVILYFSSDGCNDILPRLKELL